MTGEADGRAGTYPPAEDPHRHGRIRAARVPKPLTCGCGRPAFYDLEKHEFFCTGCGDAKVCVCLRSPFTALARPVRVT